MFKHILDPLIPQGFLLHSVEHRFFVKLKLNFGQCLANKLEGGASIKLVPLDSPGTGHILFLFVGVPPFVEEQRN